MRKVLIVGATSAIAYEAAKRFAAEGARLFLTGRNQQRLAAIVEDLKVRGADRAESCHLDINDLDRHAEMLDEAEAALGGLDTVLVAPGTLSDQTACEASVEETLRDFATNATSIIALLTLVANRFEKQEQGTIAVISSVAGDRGRQNNYVYGAAKAALSTFTAGLRSRLHKSNVAVVTIKPGPIDTPMTAHLKKGPLFATAERAGNDVYQAIVKNRDVVYVPWFWLPLMTIIKLIPERIFKRMNLAA
jgi:decaprenylphospho-beta-D-erythro-pentofuranosid-2-ulose 2-reductase